MDNFDSSRQIAIIWDIDDVHSLNYGLTDEQAMEVLSMCKKEHYDTMGINWDVIELWILYLFPDVRQSNCGEDNEDI